MNKRLTVLIVCVVLFFIAACGNPSPAPNEPSSNQTGGQNDTDTAQNSQNTDVVHEEAVAIFKVHCISCHAADLSGRVGEQSNLQKVGDRLDKQQIKNIIINGGKAMPAQTKLTEDEVELLANWLVTKK